MDFDPLEHNDYALFRAIEDLYYFLMASDDEDDVRELYLIAEIEILLEI